jgi:hypothetical protein
LDFETLCWSTEAKYPEAHYMAGQSYDYKPITEIGWTMLDTRELVKNAVAPGDRASDIFKQMSASHYIINEFRGHCGRNCTNNNSWVHETEPYNFAFSKSQYINTADITRILTTRFENALKPRNLTKHERDNKIPRNIVFLAWDAHLELKALDRLGLD